MFFHKRRLVLVFKPSFWPEFKGVFAKDLLDSLNNVRIGSNLCASGRMHAEQGHSSLRDIARYNHWSRGIEPRDLKVTGFEVGHLLDLLKEWDGMIEQAAFIEIIYFVNELFIYSRRLYNIAHEATEEGSRCVGGRDHENEAFSLDLLNCDWGPIGVSGRQEVVEEVAAMVGLWILEPLLKEAVSELR